MYAVPDVDEVVAVAKELGIHLGPEEVGLYRKYLLEQLSELDTFVQARLEEPQPPMVSAARTPGYRPRPEEDPLNAWTWKCRIEGAAAGVLAGKTVSYKDHIAVAGMRMEPPWSPPKEMSTSPAATAAPEPDDDPPVTWSWLCGLRGRP